MEKWQEKLQQAGFPTTVLLLDFESYFATDYKLGKGQNDISIVEYVCGNKFDLHCIGYTIFGDDAEELNFNTSVEIALKPELNEFIKTIKEVFGDNLERCTIVAKNCKFDVLILAEKFGIFPQYVVDIDDLLRYYDARMSHKMADVVKLFNLPSKGNTNEFKDLTYQEIESKGLLPNLIDYTKNDVEIEVELFTKLLPIICNPEIELVLAKHTLDLFIKPILVFDFKLAESLIEQMQVILDNAVNIVEPLINELLESKSNPISHIYEFTGQKLKKIINSDVKFVEILLKLGVDIPIKPGKPTKNMIPLTGPHLIPAFAQKDEGTRILLHHKDSKVVDLMTARLAVSSWPGHIKRLNNLMSQARLSRGLCRVPLAYFGAHTGRCSGEERVNLGNLGGAGRGKAINKLIGQVRHTLRAPDGFSLIMCDAAQIEARNLAWYAGQDDLLKAFAEGRDIYSEFASELFQVRVWKTSDKEEQTPEGRITVVRRGFGKDSVLGYGYGEGADTAYVKCLENDMLRPFFENGEYDFAFVQKSINLYRTRFSKIPQFWRAVEKAWKTVTLYPKEVKQVGPLTFLHNKGTTYIQLPSGRFLKYRYAKVKSHGNYMEASYVWGQLHGGKLTGNIVQSTCRDFLVQWILEIEKLGCHIVHHVYDETITVVPDYDVTKVSKQINKIMSTGPNWAKGMPFKANLKVSKFYKK